MKEINIEQATAITSPDPLMLLCTTKENGSLNMAPVSFFMYSSYNPPMLAFSMGKEANSAVISAGQEKRFVPLRVSV